MNSRTTKRIWKAMLYSLLAIDAGLLGGVCWLSLAPPVAAHAQTSSQYPELDKNGKAVIDCAVAGYNHFDADIRNACSAKPGDPAFNPSAFYIPQTRDAQQAIEKARQAQTACVEAFEAYAVAKVGKDKTVSLADKEAAVTSHLAQLPALLDAVRALIGKPAAAGAQHPAASPLTLKPREALAWLRPVAATLRSPDHGDQPITRFLPEVSRGQ